MRSLDLFFPYAAVGRARQALLLQPSLFNDADAFYAATMTGGAPPPNLIANGTFADTTAWTLETGWTISGGVASKGNVVGSSGQRIYQMTAALHPAGSYTVTFTASNVLNSGASRAEVGLQQDGGNFANIVSVIANGANTMTLTTNAEHKILVFFRASRGTVTENEATTFTIDDVALRRA